jgi:hypothetical protein
MFKKIIERAMSMKAPVKQSARSPVKKEAATKKKTAAKRAAKK